MLFFFLLSVRFLYFIIILKKIVQHIHVYIQSFVNVQICCVTTVAKYNVIRYVRLNNILFGMSTLLIIVLRLWTDCSLSLMMSLQSLKC